MRTWKAMGVACSLGVVLALVSTEAQQKGGATSSKAAALTALDYIQIQQLAQRHSFALDQCNRPARIPLRHEHDPERHDAGQRDPVQQTRDVRARRASCRCDWRERRDPAATERRHVHPLPQGPWRRR